MGGVQPAAAVRVGPLDLQVGAQRGTSGDGSVEILFSPRIVIAGKQGPLAVLRQIERHDARLVQPGEVGLRGIIPVGDLSRRLRGAPGAEDIQDAGRLADADGLYGKGPVLQRRSVHPEIIFRDEPDQLHLHLIPGRDAAARQRRLDRERKAR